MCGGNGPDGWREALHRVHEALFEACWPGTQEPILSARKGPVARTAHREARVGGKLLTDDIAKAEAKLIWKLSDRGTTARLPKNGTLRQGEAFEPSSNLERKRGLQPRSSPSATGVRAGTNRKQKKSPTRVLLCRLGPLVCSRPRCRTTVPQLVLSSKRDNPSTG